MRDLNVTNIGGLRRALYGAAAASALALAAPAEADYEVGCAAYKQGQVEVAINIWKGFAVAGDVRSKKILGDVYYGKVLEAPCNSFPEQKPRRAEYIEALKWYTLAASHDFAAYQQPTAEEVNARILAEQQLPDVRFKMSDADVDKAERLVSDSFERGSPYDLWRLGDMYQRGFGVKKDNVRALQMYELAKDRGVAAASVAFDALADALPPLVSAKDKTTAHERAVNWQPPLPPELEGQTPQMKELARLRKELEELRLQEALKAVSDIDVELIQQALAALGFYLGPIDNNMGAATKAAIKKYQYSRVETDEEKEAIGTGILTPRQTVDLIETAARNDHTLSQYVFGLLNLRGIGVVQDGNRAVDWLKKAAKKDHQLANFVLGDVYRDGTTGLNEVAPNKTEAARYYAKSCALGYGKACKAARDLEFGPPKPQE